MSYEVKYFQEKRERKTSIFQYDTVISQCSDEICYLCVSLQKTFCVF